jgi:hypothetical protein
MQPGILPGSEGVKKRFQEILFLMTRSAFEAYNIILEN